MPSSPENKYNFNHASASPTPHHHHHHHASHVPPPPTSPALSLQERRQRNKAASAKYRAKKNQQYSEMRSLISSLTKENELLSRQLEHMRRENSRLKVTCDRLRGKKVAAKILKQLLASKSSQAEAYDPLQLDEEDDDDEDEDHDVDDEMENHHR